MPPPKKSSKPTGKKKLYPSRENTKYPGIPKVYWEALELLAEEVPEYDGRSVSYLTTRAVKLFLESLKRLPPRTTKPSGS